VVGWRGRVPRRPNPEDPRISTKRCHARGGKPEHTSNKSTSTKVRRDGEAIDSLTAATAWNSSLVEGTSILLGWDFVAREAVVPEALDHRTVKWRLEMNSLSLELYWPTVRGSNGSAIAERSQDPRHERSTEAASVARLIGGRAVCVWLLQSRSSNLQGEMQSRMPPAQDLKQLTPGKTFWIGSGASLGRGLQDHEGAGELIARPRRCCTVWGPTINHHPPPCLCAANLPFCREINRGLSLFQARFQASTSIWQKVPLVSLPLPCFTPGQTWIYQKPLFGMDFKGAAEI